MEFHPQWWHWLVLGLGLMAVEMLVPGVFLLWLGLAALAIGGIVALFPGTGESLQVGAFAVLSIGAVLAGRQIARRRSSEAQPAATINARTSQLIGGIFPLLEPSRDGRGRVKVADSVWLCQFPPGAADLPTGARVRVTGATGAVLTVESVAGGDGAPGIVEQAAPAQPPSAAAG